MCLQSCEWKNLWTSLLPPEAAEFGVAMNTGLVQEGHFSNHVKIVIPSNAEKSDVDPG